MGRGADGSEPDLITVPGVSADCLLAALFFERDNLLRDMPVFQCLVGQTTDLTSCCTVGYTITTLCAERCQFPGPLQERASTKALLEAMESFDRSNDNCCPSLSLGKELHQLVRQVVKGASCHVSHAHRR